MTDQPANPEVTRAERLGWYCYDWANSAFPTTVVTVFLGPYLTSIARTAAGCPSQGTCEATLHPAGIAIRPGSLFAYAVSLSVVLSVLLLPVVGAVADRSGDKRRLLAATAYLGATATCAMVFLTGDRYLLGVALFLVANLAFGASVVVYNSFLPALAPPAQRDRVSSIGWAVGYCGGGLLLAGNVAAVLGKDALGTDSATVARYCLVSAGLWWATFTLVPLRYLRNRSTAEPGGGQPRRASLLAGFSQLATTLRELRGYPLSMAYLAVYLVYNDGIQTVIAMAGTYATEELRLADTVMVPTILMVQFLAIFGALGMGVAAGRYGAKRTIMASLGVWSVIIAIAYLMPANRPLPFVLLGGGIGLVLGGSQALSRSMFSHVIPQGKEAEYFSLYEISEKGSSFLGPLLFGLAYQVTGSYRIAIVSLALFFVVGLIGLAAVPIREAVLRAGNQPPHRL